MTKPVAKAKKKGKRTEEIAELVKPQSAKKFERALRKHVEAMDERAEVRESYVKKILDANEPNIAEVVEHMVEMFRKMQGEPFLVFQGRRFNTLDGELELLKSIQTRNFRWMSVRLLSSAAQMDIQIAGFKLPKKFCAVCGKKAIKKIAKKKGKK